METFRDTKDDDTEMAKKALENVISKSPDMVGGLFETLQSLEDNLNNPELEYKLHEIEEVDKENIKDTIINKIGSESVQSYKIFEISKIVELLKKDIEDMRNEYEITKADRRTGLMEKANVLDEARGQIVILIKAVEHLESLHARPEMVKDDISMMKNTVSYLKKILEPIKNQNPGLN